MKMRENWLDACKGFGIICVVCGHVFSSTEISRAIAWFIFLFHMPLFFLISGYTFRPEAGWTYVRKRAISLLIPYISFMLLIDALTITRAFLLEGAPTFRDLTLLVVRSILGGNYIGADFGVFWFVTCLFVALIGYNAMEVRFGASKKLIGFAIGLCFAASVVINLYPAVNALPWGLANVPLAICFLWAGRELKFTKPLYVILAAGAFILLAGVMAYAGADFTFDMKKAIYGPPVFGALFSLSLSTLLLLGFKQFGNVTYLATPLVMLGLASLVIMFLHQYVHYTLQAVGVSQEPLLIIISLIVPLLIYLMIKKNSSLSFLFLGKRKAPPELDKPNERVSEDFHKSASQPVHSVIARND